MTPFDAAIENAPLLQAMLGYAAQGRISFHMPGHQDGSGLPTAIRSRLAELDATELTATDDLNDPTGPAAAAMRAAAEAFGAAETLFVTGGSTGAIQAMVTAFCPRGSCIILPRAVHRSVLNIALLLDLRIAFLPAGTDRPESAGRDTSAGTDRPGSAGRDTSAFAPVAPPTAADLKLVLERHPDAAAVLVTSPDYFGTCPDLAALSATAAAAGCPLLVDEAHGAHLVFAPDRLPPSALAAGASACVQSAHKTLPALTQGAYLHRGKGAFLAGGHPWPDDGHLRQCLSLYQTSSPSLLIGATLDYARALLAADGTAAISRTLSVCGRFRSALGPAYRCSGQEPDGRDPLRLVIDVLATGLTGFEIARQLSAQGIDIEMADIRRLVLIPGLFQPEAELAGLAATLNRIAAAAPAGISPDTATIVSHFEPAPGRPDAGEPEIRRRIDENRSLDAAFYQMLQTPPKADTQPSGTARLVSPLLDGLAVRRKAMDDAADDIAADAIIPYPPGIPIVWPGERLDSERLALLRVLLENGFGMHGIIRESENPGIRVIG